MHVTGSCHCGEIQFEGELVTEKVGICHCTDCQQLSASAFRTIAVIPAEQFRLTKGAPKTYVKTGDSGNRRIQAFCGTCGSGIYACDDSDAPAAYNVRVGAINERARIEPQFECWHSSSLPWVPDLPHTKKFDKNPG